MTDNVKVPEKKETFVPTKPLGNITGSNAQDEFVRRVLHDPRHIHNGTFLHVGCDDPVNGNCTYSLERDHGWKGILMVTDKKTQKKANKERAQSTVVLKRDPLRCNWDAILGNVWVPPAIIDFFYLDVEEPSTVLHNMPLLSKYRFKILMVSHKSYTDDGVERDLSRKILSSMGYTMIAQDVMTPVFVPLNPEKKELFTPGDKGKMVTVPCEDWFVHQRTLTDLQGSFATLMKSDRMTGPEIVGISSGDRSITEMLGWMDIADSLCKKGLKEEDPPVKMQHD